VSELDDELTEIFRDESAGRLDEMETALLAVESGNAGAEYVDSLFRNAHTIKGAAGMLGLDDIRALAHAVEDVLAGVRGSGLFRPELAALLLRATAALRELIAGGAVPVAALLDDLADGKATLAVGEAGPARPGATAGLGMTAGRGAAAVPGLATVPGAAPRSATRPGPATARGAGHGPAAAPGPRPAAPAEPGLPGLPGLPEPRAPGTPDSAAAAPAPPEPAARSSPGPAPPGPVPPGRDAPAASPEQARPAAERMLRVPAEKIDRLLDVVGEVMQHRRRLAHSLGGQASSSQDVADVLGSSDRLLDELKDTAIGLRTLPLEVITRRLPLAVRDMARAAGKDIELVVTGADTEIDRVILESLYEPLAHLLRNAVSHGIEPTAERSKAGKPAAGRLEVRAEPRGSLVEIVVADDGRGVSPEVAGQARDEGESLGDVLARAGYSTAAEVTDLAGRGVGLDAVKSYARSMGGGFEVRSEPGQGMQVVLLLPLALALLEVLLFERAGAVYGVPLVTVREVVLVTETLSLEGRPALEVRGRPLPVADVAVLVGAPPPPLRHQAPALVISAAGRRAVVTCDAVLGKEEVVVKPLGPLFGGIEGYLGAAILGDGRIALLLDPAMLARGARRGPGAAAQPETTGPAGAGTPSAAVAGPAAAPSRPTAPKILVAEDSFTVRELQRSILEAAGYPVVTARDGRDALAAVGRDPEIALVVADLEMPELDGLQLTRAIRADKARASLPVVIVTSRASEEDRRSGIEAGADAYMAKQAFDQQALLAIVEQLVGR
jgi:chemotaxis protein histidine kinase CheA/ActR/RegA family two-component response regulator